VFVFVAVLVVSHSGLIAAAQFDESRVLAPIAIFVFIFVCSFPLSERTTKRHRELGNEQCEFILHHKRSELEKQLLIALGTVNGR
jgi:hypothetical protein